MRRIYNYGGEVEQGFLRIDLGQIPLYQYVTENIDYEVFDEDKKQTFKMLLIKIAESNQFESITFEDKRLIYLIVKALTAYPLCLKSNNENKGGEFEYILVYQYLKDNYDKSLTELDSVIRYVNLLIGYRFMSDHKFTKNQADEFNILSNVCSSVSSDYVGIIPKFVINVFNAEYQIEPNETIQDVIEDVIEDNIEDVLEDQVDMPQNIEDEVEEIQEEEEVVKVLSEKDAADVEEYKVVIETLSVYILDEKSKKKVDEWTIVISTLKEFIEKITGKPYTNQKMQLGGITQRFSSPALLQFQGGGLVERFSSPLPQTPKFGGDPMMFKGGGKVGFKNLAKRVAANYKGKKVKPKYQSQYGKTYSESEAKEVGNKIAAKVYRAQQKNK